MTDQLSYNKTMKLLKSKAGKFFIILYYTFLFITDFFLTVFIMLKTDSILAGMGIGIMLSIGIGILGGELEFREHCKEKHKKHSNVSRVKEAENVINFPVN
jgi:hypothetical protein